MSPATWSGNVDELFWGIIIVVSAALSLGSAGHALLFKRDPRSAVGWIGVCLTFPFVGPFFYWIMGINWINRKARNWMESGRRLAGWDCIPAYWERPAAKTLPDGAQHLVELRALSDRVVSTELVPGNHLTPLLHGEAAYPAMLAAIAGATHSIHLSTYIFDGDETGRRFADALRQAAERGVEVRVIVDALGEKYSKTTARRLLKGSKVSVGRFLPLRHGGYLNLRNHRKIMVVDGVIGFTGGMNIGDRHLVERLDNAARVVDCHFRVAGPVVSYLQRTFLEDWYFVTGELVNGVCYFPPIEPVGPTLARAISDGPDKEFRKLHWIVMGALACARQRVRIMTPYFIPDRPLISALVTAALRGVEVHLVLPAHNNLPFVHWASRAYLWEILQHGIRVFYQPPPFVHSKVFQVDGVWSLVGSANLDPRSLRLNFEFNLELYDREFAGLMERHFDEILANSHEITLTEMDSRPLWEKLLDSTAKLFSPYL